MTLNRRELALRIEAKLDQLGADYASCQGLILTEDDLKCYLYARLSEIPGLMEPRPTRDPRVLAPRLHAELTWFDDMNRLSIKPDLTILEPENLDVGLGQRTLVHLPSKGYRFDGQAVIFELKFIRNRRGLTTRAVTAIRKDVQKIRRLLDKYDRLASPDAVFCFFVVVTKSGNTCQEFHDLVAAEQVEERFRFVVKSADALHPPRVHHAGA